MPFVPNLQSPAAQPTSPGPPGRETHRHRAVRAPWSPCTAAFAPACLLSPPPRLARFYLLGRDAAEMSPRLALLQYLLGGAALRERLVRSPRHRQPRCGRDAAEMQPRCHHASRFSSAARLCLSVSYARRRASRCSSSADLGRGHRVGVRAAGRAGVGGLGSGSGPEGWGQARGVSGLGYTGLRPEVGPGSG